MLKFFKLITKEPKTIYKGRGVSYTSGSSHRWRGKRGGGKRMGRRKQRWRGHKGLGKRGMGRRKQRWRGHKGL